MFVVQKFQFSFFTVAEHVVGSCDNVVSEVKIR